MIKFFPPWISSFPSSRKLYALLLQRRYMKGQKAQHFVSYSPRRMVSGRSRRREENFQAFCSGMSLTTSLKQTDSLSLSFLAGPQGGGKGPGGKALGPFALQTRPMSQIGHGNKGVTTCEGVPERHGAHLSVNCQQSLIGIG